MKKLIMLCSLVVSTISFAQSITETKVSSDIKDVTVFITGGEVTREASVNLKKGRNKIYYCPASQEITRFSCHNTSN